MPGAAVGKAKKFNRRLGIGFNPPETAAYMNLVALCAQREKVPRIDGPVSVWIEAGFEWPRSRWTKAGRNVEWMIGKPDADNIAKSVLDGLRAHFDDRQVAALKVHKFRLGQGEAAYAKVMIIELKADAPR